MTDFNKEMALDEEMEQNRKYKGLIDEMYAVSSQASTLREQMKKLIKEFDECYPTEEKAVKQMLETCQEEARERLKPHFLIQFYGDDDKTYFKFTVSLDNSVKLDIVWLGIG